MLTVYCLPVLVKSSCETYRTTHLLSPELRHEHLKTIRREGSMRTYFDFQDVIVQDRVSRCEARTEDTNGKLVASFGVEGIPDDRSHNMLVQRSAAIEVVDGEKAGRDDEEGRVCGGFGEGTRCLCRCRSSASCDKARLCSRYESWGEQS